MAEFTEKLQESMLPHIRGLGIYQGVEPVEVMAERAGIPQDRIIRLNGNENPYGASPVVAEALASFPNFNHYPDPEQRQLREALSGYVGIEPERIIAGNGSDELIDMLFRMFVGPGDNIINLTPTFGMYSIGAEICGGQAISVPRDENFDIDLEGIKLAITPRTKAIVVCSPNNPTGNMPSEAEVRALLDTGILVIVDEAYYEFNGNTLLPLLDEYPNLVVLRTFSKWAGLAGLRIGSGRNAPRPGGNDDVGQAPLQRQPGRRGGADRIAQGHVGAAGAGQRHRRRTPAYDWAAGGHPHGQALSVESELHPLPVAGGNGAAGVRRAVQPRNLPAPLEQSPADRLCAHLRWLPRGKRRRGSRPGRTH